MILISGVILLLGAIFFSIWKSKSSEIRVNNDTYICYSEKSPESWEYKQYCIEK